MNVCFVPEADIQIYHKFCFNVIEISLLHLLQINNPAIPIILTVSSFSPQAAQPVSDFFNKFRLLIRQVNV